MIYNSFFSPPQDLQNELNMIIKIMVHTIVICIAFTLGTGTRMEIKIEKIHCNGHKKKMLQNVRPSSCHYIEPLSLNISKF